MSKTRKQRQQEFYDSLDEKDAKIMKYINDTIEEIRREKRNTRR